MTLKFAQCRDDPRKVDKTLTDVHTVNNASIYQACSIMAPEFVVDYSLSLLACNYLVAGITAGQNEIARCYFIKDQIVLPGGRLVVRCAIDVLNTWKNSIKKCTANIIRNEFSGNPDIIDSCMQANSRTCVFASDLDDNVFTSRPTGHCYMLTVIGGSHTAQPEMEATTK